MTDLQREIKAELRRIRKLATRLEKRGYADIKIPKYSAKNASRRTLARLKNIKTKQLKEAPTTTYHGSATYGEQVTGKQGAKAERSAAAKKAAITRRENRERSSIPGIDTLKSLLEELRALPDFISYQYAGAWFQAVELTPQKNIFIRMVEAALENPTKDVIRYYQSVYGDIQKNLGVIDYESKGEKIEYAITQVGALIKGAPLTREEKEEISYYAETFEGVDIELWEE